MELTDLKARAGNFRSRVSAQRHLEADLQSRQTTASQDRQDKSGAHIFLQHLAKQLTEKSESQASKLATLALQEVFFDLQLSLEAEHGDQRGVPATTLKIRDSEKGVVGKPSKAFGGGPGALLGIVLRVVTVMRQKGLARVLILDEPMIHVSGQYQERAAKLVRKLCEPVDKGGLGFDMLVVTHNPVFMATAHKSYYASSTDNGSSLQIREGSIIEAEEEI